MDVQGALGLNRDVRNGFSAIRVSFSINAPDAPSGKLQDIVDRAYARSAVFDSITRGVPVTVSALPGLSASRWIEVISGRSSRIRRASAVSSGVRLSRSIAG